MGRTRRARLGGYVAAAIKAVHAGDGSLSPAIVRRLIAMLTGIAGSAEQVAQVTRYRLHVARPSSRRHVAVRPDQDDIIVEVPPLP